MQELATYRVFLRSIVASVLCFGVDFLICLALVTGLKWNYLPATAFSFTTATVLNYLICSRWAFRRVGRDSSLGEFVIFLGLSALGLFLNGLSMYLLTGLAGLNFLYARILAASGVFFFNFGCRKLLLDSSLGEAFVDLLARLGREGGDEAPTSPSQS